MKCCRDTISTWYRWFEPAGLGGWSCNKQVIQPMGAESVRTDRHVVSGGAGGIPLLRTPRQRRVPVRLAELPWENVARRRRSWYFSGSFPSCPARGCGDMRGLCGVPGLPGGCSEPEGAGGALGVSGSCQPSP